MISQRTILILQHSCGACASDLPEEHRHENISIITTPHIPTNPYGTRLPTSLLDLDSTLGITEFATFVVMGVGYTECPLLTSDFTIHTTLQTTRHKPPATSLLFRICDFTSLRIDPD